LRSPTVTPNLQRIAAQAAHDPDRVFTTLAHLIDEDFLREAYRQTSKASAAGIDGVTAQTYAEHLDEHLRDLHERLRSGRYQAPPVERVWLEKADGGQRPIGKPTFEDKIVQRAVAMLLEAIDEQDFYDGSYGFRQGRSPHDALHELRERCMNEGIGWIVDADVSGYFDSIDKTRLREVLRKRVKDGRIERLIGKWLHAGVMEEGVLTHPETGVPQGGVRTPPTILQTFFPRAGLYGMLIDPKHHMYQVMCHFHALHQGADQLPLAQPVGGFQPRVHPCRELFEAPNDQMQFCLY
jgi:RNA-directed DNA polymerase